MKTAEKRTDAPFKHIAEQSKASACYICGRLHTENGELCPDCAEIVGTGLRLLRTGEKAC